MCCILTFDDKKQSLLYSPLVLFKEFRKDDSIASIPNF